MNQFIPAAFVHPTFAIGLLLQILFGIICILGPLLPSSSSAYNPTAQLIQTLLRLALTWGILLTPVFWIIYLLTQRYGYNWRLLCTWPLFTFLLQIFLTYLFYKYLGSKLKYNKKG